MDGREKNGKEAKEGFETACEAMYALKKRTQQGLMRSMGRFCCTFIFLFQL